MCLSTTSLIAQNSVIPGAITLDATFTNLGIGWTITGDDNLNSSLTIEYRPSGSGAYLPALEPIRANPLSVIDGSTPGYNYHAGSILFLEPGSSYDIRLTLTDPDGGDATEIISGTTKSELAETLQGNDLYVVPGSGGGSGSQSDPYLGLQAAADDAEPGDIFNVAAGVYSPFSLDISGSLENPIVFRGSAIEDGNTTLEGGGTDRGIITLGENSDSIRHVVIERMVLQNGRWGVDALHAQHITFRRNVVRNVQFGYLNRRESGREHDQTISDNQFVGLVNWPEVNASDRGIDLRGNRNVVRYNHIRSFGDGVSTDGQPYEQNTSMDIHNNDIANMGDDIIEVDGAIGNVRIWSNKGINARSGISVAPIFGGPCYVFRNFLLHFQFSSYKMNRSPAGLVMIHNTAASWDRGSTSPTGYQNTRFRNNVLFAGEYVYEEYELQSTSLFDDWDFNGYSSDRSGVDTIGGQWFKWDDVRYATFADLQAGGLELNSESFDHDIEYPGIPISSEYQSGADPDESDFAFAAGSLLANKGEVLNNINDPFVSDGQPDLGALEEGSEMPQLGPRFPLLAGPVSAVTTGSIQVDATYESIGVLWNLQGDDNLNSTMTLEYSEAGAGSYLPGVVTMRANPLSIVDGLAPGYNYHAGSAMFLIPGTTYDLRLTLTDSDGGSVTEVITATTKAELPSEIGGNDKYVAEGNGGGSGTQADPYLGLQAAADQAQPGDVFHIAAGNYAAVSIDVSGTAASPIVFRGSFDGDSTIIDGAGTSRGIITLGENISNIEHIVIEQCIIQNGDWGVDAIHAAHITFRHNIVRDVDFGYLNRREDGTEHDQTISDNYFFGRNTWPATGIPDERAIDLRGNLNVVRYNHVRNFGDAISTDGPPYQTSFGMDIHNNDLAYLVDDAIEVDGAIANTRTWSNKCVNARAGLSLAPIYGGPVYVLRNFLFNFENSTYKMNRGPAGIVVMHNTAGSTDRGTTSPTGFQNTYFRNNILFAGEYVYEEFSLQSTSLFDDWDYNGYSSNRSGADMIGGQWFKWDDVRYPLFSDLQAAGLETNSLAFNHEVDLPGLALPADYESGVDPEMLGFELNSGSSLFDQGESLDNVNIPFVADGQPDMGAVERGEGMPHLGPRPPSMTTGFADVKLDNACITLLPNPTSGIFRLEGLIGAYSIRILDATGQVVQTLDGTEAVEVDISTLPNGLYFVAVRRFGNAALSLQQIIKN